MNKKPLSEEWNSEFENTAKIKKTGKIAINQVNK